VKAHETNQNMLDAVGNMYLDMCEDQGVNVSEYIEQLDNTEESNLLPKSEEDQQ